MSTSDAWSRLLHWSRAVANDINIDEEERDYKLELAQRLAGVRSQVVDDNPAWPGELRKALTSSNLLNQYFLMPLIEKLKQDRHSMREALVVIWTPEPSPELLAPFAEMLAAVPGSKFSPGNVLALGSLLLMARDPGQFPPFRANAVKRWLELVGRVVPKPSAPPSVRYRALLDFLDEFLERVAGKDIPIRDRLDAQGLAWTLTQVPPPDDWPAEQVQAFLEWRGDAPAADMEPLDAAQRAWLVRPGQGAAGLVDEWRREGSSRSPPAISPMCPAVPTCPLFGLQSTRATSIWITRSV